MYVRNVERGLRGVNTTKGTVYLAPGEGREVELVAAEEAVARATGWFMFEVEGEEAAPKEPGRRKTGRRLNK